MGKISNDERWEELSSQDSKLSDVIVDRSSDLRMGFESLKIVGEGVKLHVGGGGDTKCELTLQKLY